MWICCSREQQIHIELLERDAIQPEHIQVMYGFYLSTIDKKWASAYLTLDFFRQIQTSMRENVVLIMARAMISTTFSRMEV